MPVLKVVAEGLVVGLVTGMVGAGGGFLVVPALALLGGLPMPVAVGTSLVVIAMKSFAGLAGHLSSVTIDWKLAAMVTASAVVGALIGARLTALVNPDSLRQAFGWFVLVMSSVILVRNFIPRSDSARRRRYWPRRWSIPSAAVGSGALLRASKAPVEARAAGG